ncbi:MAG: barstar family protein [Polyangiaceae bacterium]
MAKRVFEINGHDFDTIEGFYDEIGRKVFDDTSWGRNLDAFNDVLRGGFGTPEEGFVLRSPISAGNATSPAGSRNCHRSQRQARLDQGGLTIRISRREPAFPPPQPAVVGSERRRRVGQVSAGTDHT